MSAFPGPLGTRGQLPSGTVTFAFTDIVGSTRRWERDRSAMQEAVRRHDALVRAALTAHGGHVFKTVGDAFCAAFSRPEDAVAGALAVHRVLAAEDFSTVDGLHVRTAIHSGTADERDGDYFGPAVNRVARLLAIGHGGQVLVSGVSADLMQGALPPQASLKDLGEHRLKDLPRPQQVYQLLAPDLAAEFPPLRSIDVVLNNLPPALTSFIGRQAEIGQITTLLESHRLVTVVGSGGIGKTRTSLQVAANLRESCADGVWLIELAPLASGNYIPATVAQPFGLTLPASGDPVKNLASMLGSKRALLLFDNCEHLIEAAAHVIAAILQGCPNVKVLASSRQALGIAGEETYRLPSLEVPGKAPGDSLKATDAGECAAIALFAERARAVDKHFTLSDTNVADVAEICRRLDGIPLAIELAAARVKILSPAQLSAHLDERFRMLTAGSRDALPRQKTLRALIDWSHDLLDDRERMLFRRLGIFVNGFTLEGALAVGTGAELDDVDVIEVLESLVDKSLVLVEPRPDGLRYRLLESTRVYAGERLAAADERAGCESRHLHYLHDRFAKARAGWERTARRAELDDTLATELEDVRAALDWALRGSEAAIGSELIVDAGHAWGNLGLDTEALARIDAFLAVLSQGEPRILSRLSIAVAMLAGNSGRKAREFEAATQAVMQARACDNPGTLAEALGEYSLSAARLQKLDEAEAALSEAEAISNVSTPLRLRLLQGRAFVSTQRGDLARAAWAFEELREQQRLLGNSREARNMTLNLAEVEHARGQTRRAVTVVHEMLPALRAQSNRQILVMGLTNLAGYLAAVDDLPGTNAAAREAIRELAAREPESAIVATAMEHLALTLALGGDLARAAELAGYINAAFQRHGFEREFTESATHERLTALLRERLAPDEFARLLRAGAALVPEAAVTLALDSP